MLKIVESSVLRTPDSAYFLRECQWAQNCAQPLRPVRVEQSVIRESERQPVSSRFASTRCASTHGLRFKTFALTKHIIYGIMLVQLMKERYTLWRKPI